MERDERAVGRHVFLVSFHFDDETEIGARRARALARILPREGWNVTVITAGAQALDASEGALRVRHAPAGSRPSSIRRLIGVDDAALRELRGQSHAGVTTRIRMAASALLDFAPATLAWSRRATRLSLELADRQAPAVIMSTSPPHTAHLAARAVALKLGVPWVAELRDLWSQNADRRVHRLRRIPDRLLERLVLRRAKALVTVSDPLVDALRMLHQGVPIAAIPTGFDPELVAPQGQTLSPRFTVAYTGRIYPGYQHLGHLLRPLAAAITAGEINSEDVDIALATIGALDDADTELIRDLGLTGVVRTLPRLAYLDAIALQRQAQVLLHLRWDDPNQKGITTGKLSDYLAARRPILSVGRYQDVVGEILRRTGAGIATDDEQATREYLVDAYRAFRRTGSVPYLGDPAELAKHDARETVRAVATLLSDIAERTAP